MPFSKIVSYVFLPAIAAGIIGWFIPGKTIFSDRIPMMHLFLPVYRLLYFISASGTAVNGFDRKRIGTLFTLFGVSIIFWNIYNQNATSLTIWADSYTKREAPQFIAKSSIQIWISEYVNTNRKKKCRYWTIIFMRR